MWIIGAPRLQCADSLIAPVVPDQPSASPRRPLEPGGLERARRVVTLAWADLPKAERRLLASVGADAWEVVDQPLGGHAHELLISSGSMPLSTAARRDIDRAVGVWIGELRLVLIDAGHHALALLDQETYEMMLARTAWHEWAHALSVHRAEARDVADGARLLDLAPPGVAAIVRGGGYRRGEYTHEIVAEVYALLMLRRLYGAAGKPSWLDDEIYNLVRRVSGWTD